MTREFEIRLHGGRKTFATCPLCNKRALYTCPISINPKYGHYGICRYCASEMMTFGPNYVRFGVLADNRAKTRKMRQENWQVDLEYLEDIVKLQ